MQTVDVQDVGVSKLQMLFLQRWGLRSSRTGQGGGAAGRKLYLKTREALTPAKGRRRRGRGKLWDFSEGRDLPLQGGARSTTQQFNLNSVPVGRPEAKPPSLASLSSPHMRFYTVQTSSPFTSSFQPSPATSYVSSAASLLHSTPLPPPPPPPAPPPHEEQPEHIDRLLEEVMMGLDILPNNNNNGAPLPASSSTGAYASCSTLTQNKQQGSTTGPGSDGSTQVVSVARGGGSLAPANSEVPVLQQQGEGELNEMLNQFLQSFERHIENCTDRDEGTAKTPHTPHLQNTHTQSDEAQTPQRRTYKTVSAAPPKPAEKVKAPARRRRRKNEYLFSLERKKKRVRVRKPVSSSDAKTKIVDDGVDKQLKQIPVVKLERRGLLPARVALQECSCLEVKKPSKATSTSSSVTRECSSEKPQTVSWITKTYPIRSRFRQAQIMDSMPFLEEPLLHKGPPKANLLSRRTKKNAKLLSLSNDLVSSTPAIQPQPVEPCDTDEQLERNQERHEDLTVQPQEETEGPTRRGEKRRAESEEETSDDATVAKRVCFEQTAQPTSETLGSESAPATRNLKDISSGGHYLQREREEEPAWRGFKLRETEESLMDEHPESCDEEMIDVGGPTPPLCSVSPSSHSVNDVILGSTGSCEEDKDEDIDVIGSSSPAPDPVIINWTQSSEGEEEEEDEDIDVIGEKTDNVSLLVFAAVSRGELVDRKYQTQMFQR
ncbi:uncharacterized protein LOC131981319 [Centropristis striata]|uniref:uncharacterized protein LOC131981319 n=1 Tax=Centropristis striata TaxID=184440 RepID=UPI0027E1F522|nr:uncharacterized protein LOC131981319 [Centropristis striata]